MELSYTSGSQSSQYGSPSARASLRSSNVPYMPYSSSPLMVQSYPPAHVPTYPLPESPQYSLLALTPPPTGAAPPTANGAVGGGGGAPGYSQLPSTSASASFLQPRQAPGAHELRKLQKNTNIYN